jgi:hypothetical protein
MLLRFDWDDEARAVGVVIAGRVAVLSVYAINANPRNQDRVNNTDYRVSDWTGKTVSAQAVWAVVHSDANSTSEDSDGRQLITEQTLVGSSMRIFARLFSSLSKEDLRSFSSATSTQFNPRSTTKATLDTTTPRTVNARKKG